MKIAVILTSSRAQETIDTVKALLTNISPDNTLEISIRTGDPGIQQVLDRYLPKDPRVAMQTQVNGDVMWMINDSSLPPAAWDTRPEIVAQFISMETTPEPVAPPVPEATTLDELIDTDTATVEGLPEVHDHYGIDETDSTTEKYSEDEEWVISNYIEVDGNTKLAVLKRKPE